VVGGRTTKSRRESDIAFLARYFSIDMQTYLRQLSARLYDSDSAIRRGRKRRMERMVELVNPPPDARIIDLGGTIYNWELLDHKYRVTLVNLPDGHIQRADDSRYRFVEADGCDLKHLFDDHSFDMVFSNSTIEHVGDAARQQSFADEVRRLGPAFWSKPQAAAVR